MSEWIQKAQSTQLEVRNFKLFDDRSLDLVLHCRTLGVHRPGNAVLLLHGTTGSGKQFLQPEMANPLFAPGGPLDVEKYFVVLPDAIGHGESSKPSDGLEQDFPRYGYGDMVAAQHLLLTEGLGIRHLRLVAGTSMGGMQTWMWGARFPEMMDALMPIASLPCKITGRNLLMRRIMIAAIRNDPRVGRPGASGPLRGIGFAWLAFKLLTESPARMAEDLVHPDRADEFIETVAAEAMRTELPNDVIWEFDASRDYDPEPELDKIQAPLVAVNFCDDELNQPGFAILTRLIENVPRGRSVTIPAGPTTKGHQSLRRPELWLDELRKLLADTEPDR
jgi:homoserine O-acetyltransferase/O-succinyltransferase